MKVVVSVTLLRSEEKQIVEHLKKNSIEVDIMTEKNNDSLTNLKEYDLAIIRNLSQKTCLQRAKLFESLGVKCINSLDVINIATDKLIQSNIFSSYNLPIPNYEVVFTETNYMDLFNRFNDTFIIKPINASWGRGIVRINNTEEFNLWKETVSSLDLKKQNFPYLAQEYINKENYDVRILVIGKKIEGIFKRVSMENWKTNTHLGAEVVPIKVTKEIKNIVDKILVCTNDSILGIDLLFDIVKQRYVICEINNNPEFAKSSKIYGVDIGEKISKYIIKELKND